MKYIVLILAVMLSGVGCAHTSCRVGAGIEHGETNMYIYKVFEGSPAEKAGVTAGGRINAMETDWPKVPKAGKVRKFTIHYGDEKRVYHIKQERMCFHVPSKIW